MRSTNWAKSFLHYIYKVFTAFQPVVLKGPNSPESDPNYELNRTTLRSRSIYKALKTKRLYPSRTGPFTQSFRLRGEDCIYHRLSPPLLTCSYNSNEVTQFHLTYKVLMQSPLLKKMRTFVYLRLGPPEINNFVSAYGYYESSYSSIIYKEKKKGRPNHLSQTPNSQGPDHII